MVYIPFRFARRITNANKQWNFPEFNSSTIAFHNNALILVVAHFIRTQYEDQEIKSNVPKTLKLLIKSYTEKNFSSTILTIDEDLEITDLLSTELKLSPINYQFRLIYRASEHNHRIDTYHQLCDKFDIKVVFIKTNFGNVFGGLLHVHDTNMDEIEYDEKTNIFAIRNVHQDQHNKYPIINPFAINDRLFNGITSGSEWQTEGPMWCDTVIIGDCHNVLSSAAYGHLCGGYNKSRGFYIFKTVEYEVFAIYHNI